MTKEIERTLSYEGGYSNDLDDFGQETNFGISKRYHPDVDIKHLTKEQAIEIYKHEYWDVLMLDRFTFNPFKWKAFDISVNLGQTRAANFLREVKHPDTLQGCWELATLQIRHYTSRIHAKPDQVKYIVGWMTRALDLGEGL